MLGVAVGTVLAAVLGYFVSDQVRAIIQHTTAAVNLLYTAAAGMAAAAVMVTSFGMVVVAVRWQVACMLLCSRAAVDQGCMISAVAQPGRICCTVRATA